MNDVDFFWLSLICWIYFGSSSCFNLFWLDRGLRLTSVKILYSPYARRTCKPVAKALCNIWCDTRIFQCLPHFCAESRVGSVEKFCFFFFEFYICYRCIFPGFKKQDIFEKFKMSLKLYSFIFRAIFYENG